MLTKDEMLIDSDENSSSIWENHSKLNYQIPQGTSEVCYYNIRKSSNDKNEYIYKKLKNNLNCVLIYDKEADKSAAALTVNVGSLCDPEEFQGLAHFLEHMLFMGTEKYPNENDFSEFLTKNSGDSNAYTGLDSTQYYFDVKNEAFIEALDKFAQFFIKPLFNKSAVEREMKAVESEHKKYMRSDNNRFLEIFRSESNPKTPFRKFQTGSLITLKKPNVRKALKKFHDMYYSSNIMNLVILSNIPLDKLEKLADDLFSGIKEIDTNIDRIRKNYLPDNIQSYTHDYNLSHFYHILNVKDKNTLSFYWIINENMYKDEKYKVDPMEYITSILHHEGKNSLTSILLKDEFITNLDSSHEVIAHTFTQVYVNAHLTEKGYQNYEEIIRRVLAFVKRIQALPVNKHYFDEIQRMTYVDFDFFEKDDPVNFCSDLSENMAYYKPEDLLTGHYLIEKYDEKLIKSYIDMLTCENLNIYLCSNKFSMTEDDVITEKWYEVKYRKKKVDFNQYLENNVNGIYFKDYFYPEKNQFIPKNFELKNFENFSTEYTQPKIIQSRENYNTVWYKPDTKFKMPKAFILAQVYLPFSHFGTLCDKNNPYQIGKSFTNNLDYAHYRTYLGLWHDIFYDELKEIVYLGSLARIDFSMYNNEMGFCIELSGFNDTLKQFSEEIFTLFVKISNRKNIENFRNKLLNKIKNRIRIEKNSFKSSANAQVSNKLTAFITYPFVCLDKSIEILEELKSEIINEDKFSKFEFFLENYFSRSYFEWLVQGNLYPEEGIEIISFIQDLLQKSGMKLLEINQVRTVKLPSDYNFYHIFESQDDGNENSAIISYFQVGYLTEKESCLLELIEQILYDKFFDELRTKQALGYLVSLSHRYNRKIEGIVCLVQSNVQSPEFIYKKINKFFDDFNLTDENNLADQDFISHRDALINNLKQKDLTLWDEVDRNFGEIRIREYVFNRDHLRIKIYENEINKKDVVDFYEKHFIENVRRIDIELVSQNHKKENEKLLMKSLKEVEESMKHDSGIDECDVNILPNRVEVRYEDVLRRMCEMYADYYYYIKK